MSHQNFISPELANIENDINNAILRGDYQSAVNIIKNHSNDYDFEFELTDLPNNQYYNPSK